MKIGETEYRILLRDERTGVEAWCTDTTESDKDGMEFWLTDGNGGCDCNRGTWLADALRLPDDDELRDRPCCEYKVNIMAAEWDGQPWPEVVCVGKGDA